MPFLNLHAHSTYSDGSDSIEAMAKVFKQHGHAAFVLTDHDDIVVALTTQTWQKIKDECDSVSKKMNGYPILSGLEIYVPGEECLLFGDKACQEWLSLLEVNTRQGLQLPTIKNWIRSMITRNLLFSLVLCHPSLRCIDPDFYSLLDGYEVMNAGQMWSDDMISRMKQLMPTAKPFRNLDAHSTTDIIMECNEISPETARSLFKPNDNKSNMKRLIGWIKQPEA